MKSPLQNLLFELSARSSNILQPKLEKKLVYIHIPKCGGVSISKALKSCYINWNVLDRNLYKLNSVACLRTAQISADKKLNVHHLEVTRLRKNLMLYGMTQPQVQYISGHFVFNLEAYEAFHNEYSFVTILREPVKRWISAYFYNRYKSYGNDKTNLDIEEYLNSEAAYRGGQAYLHALCGLTDIEGYPLDDLVSKAKENLHKFSLVGCIEYVDTFTQQFHERFGRQIKIGRWNKSPKSKSYQQSLITSDMIGKIEKLCRPDIEIYDYAVREFVSRH